MALARLGAGALAERREALRRPAERHHALDGRDRRADTRHLRLGLIAAPDDAERAGAAPREVTGRDAAGRAGPKLPEPIRLDDGDELRALRVEQADDERRAGRRRRVQLSAGEPELRVGGGHVCERALGEPEPPPRRDLDVAVGHAPEARLDRVDGELRRDQLGDVRFGEIERHERQV